LLLPDFLPNDGLIPAFKAQSLEWKRQFLELAVTGYVNLLRGDDAASSGSGSSPALPAPGGFGNLNLESRNRLCASYLCGESPDYRAYLQIRLLADPIGDEGGNDHRQTREFRLAWALFIESHPLKVLDHKVGEVVAPEARWRLGLAVCVELARAESDDEELATLCSTIVKRFTSNKNPAPLAPLVNSGDFAIPTGPSTPQWEAVKVALADKDQKGILLARLMFHVVCSRLQINPARRGDFTDAWLQWLHDVAKEVSSGSTCSPECCTAAAQSMGIELTKLQPFGGSVSPDSDSKFPACFRSYHGGSRQWLLAIESALNPESAHDVDHRPAVRMAYLLGVTMADKLSDMVQVHSERQKEGPGFKPEVYEKLADLIGTKEKQQRQAQGRQERLGFSAHSRQLHRLFTELGRHDERLYAAMAAIEASCREEPRPSCPMCTRAPANRQLASAR
jgi:hypothetical protein